MALHLVALLAGPPVVSGVIAASTGTSSSFTLEVIAIVLGGVVTPGAVVWMLVNNKLHTHGAYQQVVGQLAAKDTEIALARNNEHIAHVALDRAQDRLMDSIVPVMTTNNLMLENLGRALDAETHLRRRAPRPRGGDGS